MTSFNFPILDRRKLDTTHSRSWQELQANENDFMALASTADKTVWRCDPDEHVENKTFYRMINVFQGFLTNEMAYHPSECGLKCEQAPKTVSSYCLRNQECSPIASTCNEVFECMTIGFVDTVCYTWEKEQKHPVRKYEYLLSNFNNKNLKFGTDMQRGCGPLEKPKAYKRGKNCNYCICKCKDPEKSNSYYFSLKEQLADQKKNEVVVGVKLHLIYNTFFLKIKVGQLMPHGLVRASSTRWIDIKLEKPTKSAGGKEFYHIGFYQRKIDLDMATMGKIIMQ